MMKRRWVLSLMAVAMFGVAATWASAAEESTRETSKSNAATAAPATPTPPASPEMPGVMPATTLDGTVAMIDLKAVPPALKVVASDGKTHVLACPSDLRAVWRDGRMSPLSQLKVGDAVSVNVQVKSDGTSVVTSIRASTAPPVASPASSSHPAH